MMLLRLRGDEVAGAAVLGVLLWLLVFAHHTWGAERPTLVYTMQPRLGDPIGEYGGAANWQYQSDSGRIHGKVVESDVAIDHPTEGITTIFDCTGTDRICAAHEPDVSPDGKRIVFAVGIGTKSQAWPLRITGSTYDVPGWVQFNIISSELWLYEIATKKLTQLTSGHQDRTPTWCDNETLCFVSDRAGVYPNWTRYGAHYPFKSLQLHRARVTEEGLTDIYNLRPEAYMQMDPVRLTNGELLISDFWGTAELEPSSTSPRNKWSVMRSGPNGENFRAEIGRHKTPALNAVKYLDGISGSEGMDTLKTIRPVAEISPGRFAGSVYYRGNGPGTIYGWEEEPGEGTIFRHLIEDLALARSESYSAWYVNTTLRLLTPFASSQDANTARRYADGKLAGRASHPQVYTGEGVYMYTHCRGRCYTQASAEETQPELNGGEPGAKREIRVAMVDRVTDPYSEQTGLIACGSMEYNCWDAHVVAPYKDKYGQEIVPMPPLPEGKTALLNIVNVRHFQHTPIAPQADLSKATHLRVSKVLQWENVPTRKGHFGTEIFGNFPLQQDGSLSALVTCDTPYVLAVVDAAGNVLAEDQKPISVSCGETVTCLGCHVHDRDTVIGLHPPEEIFSRTQAAQAKPAGC